MSTLLTNHESPTYAGDDDWLVSHLAPILTAITGPAIVTGKRTLRQVADAVASDEPATIVTAENPHRRGRLPEMTPEEHQRRGDAADALWRELVCQATGK